MQKQLVLIGGGHAHMVTLANLATITAKGHGVTVIGPSDHHYYSGMGPGMLSDTYRPEEIRFATRQVVEKMGGTFVKAKAARIDPQQKRVILESGESIPYDVLSCNAGSHVPQPKIDGDLNDIFTVKPIERLMEAKSRLIDLFGRHCPGIAIVGGGPSSAEVAGNVWQLATDTGKYKPEITICAGKAFMGRFTRTVRQRIAGTLRKRGITIREGVYVKSISSAGVILDNGETLPADFIFLALGVETVVHLCRIRHRHRP